MEVNFDVYSAQGQREPCLSQQPGWLELQCDNGPVGEGHFHSGTAPTKTIINIVAEKGIQIRLTRR